ncbi:MAG: site-2 protease family protein [Victivallaceae bacterium]|nr:site-2 protease family protein [Victivallaceae bacterium]
MDNLFINTLMSNPRLGAIWLAVVIFSISCHEFAHAAVATIEGDDTAAKTGHLTLNPLRQMGVISLLMLLFIGIAWGQVPVNPANLRRKTSRLLVSLAGVGMNLVLAVLFLFVAALSVERSHLFWLIGLIGGELNLALLLLNLLPVPPLDGFTACREIFPGLRRMDTTEFGRGAMLVMILFIFSFGSIWLFQISKWAANKIMLFLIGVM